MLARNKSPPLPVGFELGTDVLELARVVEAAVKLLDTVEVVATVMAPAPRPGPLATGAVVTVEKVAGVVTLTLAPLDWAGALVDREDADPEDAEEEEPEEEPGEELFPFVTMLCQEPDISP